jgi:hypothetical protein
MKKIYLFLSLAMIMLIWSCEEKENMDPVGNWELTVPELGAPADNLNLVLNEGTPDVETKFEWQPAVTSNRFIIAYTFKLVPETGTEPILTLTTGNSGKDVSLTLTADELDYALWAACYPAGATVNLRWVVEAKSIEKITASSRKIAIKRFDTERTLSTLVITGEATEAGSNVSNATPMRARKNADDEQTGVFDVYINLTEGKTYSFRDRANVLSRVYGGANGALSCGGAMLIAPETGHYRVTADLVNNTYDLLKIEKWSLVGDNVEGGWGGDVPLEYKGNGVWETKTDFLFPNGNETFILRANEDWSYILKLVKDSGATNRLSGDVFMESEAGDAGVEIDNFPGVDGVHTITLDLRADAYTYTLVPEVPQEPVTGYIIGKANNIETDAVSGNFSIGTYDTPEELYLLSDGDLIATFTKDGDIFRTVKFIALEESKTYTLNSAADGSGTTYIEEDDGIIAVDHDQAYQVSVDFGTDELSWKHYNMKLFHWDQDGGGWDQRQEMLMTYTHPYKYEVTGSLTSGYHSKFNSPWEVQFGTDATALTGTMINAGDSPNFEGIIVSGTYKATIVVTDDYTTAEYAFVKQ